MTTSKKAACPKKQYQKVGFDKKLSIIDEISNGLISVNHASEVYGISRSSINYWMQKLSSFVQTKKSMSLRNKTLRTMYNIFLSFIHFSKTGKQHN